MRHSELSLRDSALVRVISALLLCVRLLPFLNHKSEGQEGHPEG
jgi:hypothetical protein